MFIKVNSINSGPMLIREADIHNVVILRLNGRDDGGVVGSTIHFKSGSYLEVRETPDELLSLLHSWLFYSNSL